MHRGLSPILRCIVASRISEEIRGQGTFLQRALCHQINKYGTEVAQTIQIHPAWVYSSTAAAAMLHERPEVYTKHCDIGFRGELSCLSYTSLVLCESVYACVGQ